MDDQQVTHEHGVGGSYTVDNDGVRRKVEGTEDHPDGNRPRDAEGRPLGNDGKPIAEEPAPLPSAEPADPVGDDA